MKVGLIVVDEQVDFCEDGALGVVGGNLACEMTARYIDNGKNLYDVIAFTKDWHLAPPNTNGGHFSEDPDYFDSWPVHCVMKTDGSKFNADTQRAFDSIERSKRKVFYKGMGRPDYSGFQGVASDGATLVGWLNDNDVTEVDICGIAGDYCVRATAEDARNLGFFVTILEPLIASVKGPLATSELVKDFKH